MKYKQWIVGCLSSIVFVIVICCAVLQYFSTRPSAYDQLQRLTQLPNPSRTITFAEQEATARQALLSQLPVGTAEQNIYTFLESRGAIRIQAQQQNQLLMSYIPKDRDNTIWVMLEDAPNKLTLVCRSHYLIQFQLNDNEALQDIVVKDHAACL